MQKRCFLAAGLLATLLLAHPVESGAGEVRISGTGMALAAMRRVAEKLEQRQSGLSVNVLPSMGSGGGLKALQDGVLDISLSARSLKKSEIDSGLKSEFCFRTALVLATQKSHVANLNLSELPGLYASDAPVWPDGTPLKVMLRAESGSEMPYLAKKVPGLGDAFAAARARSGTVIGMTDQLNTDIAESMDGALAMTTMLQILGENRRLVPVPIDGVVPSPDTLANDSYPFDMTVCLISRPESVSADAAKFLEFVMSAEGHDTIRQLGGMPLK